MASSKTKIARLDSESTADQWGWFRTLGLAALGVALSISPGCSRLMTRSPKLLDRAKSVVTQSDDKHQLHSPIPHEALADPDGMDLAMEWEMAKLAEQRGMDQEAIESFLRVREIKPTHPGVAHSLAVLYDRSGMTDAAEREYRSAIEESSQDADVHCDYGYFLYSTGRSTLAEEQFRQSLKLDPRHKQAMTNLAVVLGSEKQYDEAFQLFEKAIGPAAALHNIGMLRLRNGDQEEGRRMIAEASKKDPSIEQGQFVLQQTAGDGFTRLAKRASGPK